MTPHLGASTAEAQDCAGTHTAEQVRAALTGGVVTNAVNLGAPPSRPWRRSSRSARTWGRWRRASRRAGVDRVEAEFRGCLAEYDTRVLGIAVLAGVLRGHTRRSRSIW